MYIWWIAGVKEQKFLRRRVVVKSSKHLWRRVLEKLWKVSRYKYPSNCKKKTELYRLVQKVLQSEAALCYYNVGQLFLQSGTGCFIAMWDNFITKWDNFITEWDGYYKVVLKGTLKQIWKATDIFVFT